MAHVLSVLKIIPKHECAEAVALAKELGLELQAARYEKPLASGAFTTIPADEEIIWRDYCPTRYVPGGGEDVRALEQYAFDSVPIEVMRHWKAIKDNYAFDRYEVWTTERTPRTSDPLLIGVLGQGLYLLARWGLESPEALPIRKLAQDYHDKIVAKHTPRHVHTWPWQDEQVEIKKELDYWLGYECRVNRVFMACRRLLGLPMVPYTSSGYEM